MSYLTDEDMAMEFYILFNQCVDKYRTKDNNLSSYYRTSITNKVDKMVHSRKSDERNFSSFSATDDANPYNDKSPLFSQGETQHTYEFLFEEVQRMDIGLVDMKFIYSLFSNEKMTDVMQEMEMGRIEFKEKVEEVKEIFRQQGYDI
jgi:hypothetical protein